MSLSKRLLIYGGNGALGSHCVEYFKTKGFWVCSVGLRANDVAHKSIIIDADLPLQSQAEALKNELKEHLNSNDDPGKIFDGIFCFAGGWAGGNIGHKDFLKNCDLMWSQSVKSSAVAAHIATEYLKENGIFVLTGASSALEGTNGMVAYGMAKSAVHQLILSLKGSKSGLPNNAIGVAILPSTLDTPNNRKWMKNANTSSWTPLDHISRKVESWLQGIDVPENGSLIEIITKDGESKFNPCSSSN